MIYRILIEKGEDFGYIAHCPAIPGCHSQGSTMEETIENIKDAIKSCLEVLDKDLLPQGKELAYFEVSV
ncbi:MAG: type II toxin-antitoxin system HicB family antitoxin [Candidatus Brocadiales bacterium]